MLGLLLLSWTKKIWTGPPGSVHNALQIFLATNDFPFGCSSVPHVGLVLFTYFRHTLKTVAMPGLLDKKFWTGPPGSVQSALQFFPATNDVPFGCSSVPLVGLVLFTYFRHALKTVAMPGFLDQKNLNGPSWECPKCVTIFSRHQRRPVWLF